MCASGPDDSLLHEWSVSIMMLHERRPEKEKGRNRASLHVSTHVQLNKAEVLRSLRNNILKKCHDPYKERKRWRKQLVA